MSRFSPTFICEKRNTNIAFHQNDMIMCACMFGIYDNNIKQLYRPKKLYISHSMVDPMKSTKRSAYTSGLTQLIAFSGFPTAFRNMVSPHFLLL